MHDHDTCISTEMAGSRKKKLCIVQTNFMYKCCSSTLYIINSGQERKVFWSFGKGFLFLKLIKVLKCPFIADKRQQKFLTNSSLHVLYGKFITLSGAQSHKMSHTCNRRGYSIKESPFFGFIIGGFISQSNKAES